MPVQGLQMQPQAHSEADAEPPSTSKERDATSKYEMVLFKDMTDNYLEQHFADRTGRCAEVNLELERLRKELREIDVELLDCENEIDHRNQNCTSRVKPYQSLATRGKPVHGLLIHVQPHSEADAEPTSTSEERDATSEYETVLFKDMTDDVLKQHIADRTGRRAEVNLELKRLRAELNGIEAELLDCRYYEIDRRERLSDDRTSRAAIPSSHSSHRRSLIRCRPSHSDGHQLDDNDDATH
jgi:septal ring factor EnvC (AmiA/AmiB activator)